MASIRSLIVSIEVRLPSPITVTRVQRLITGGGDAGGLAQRLRLSHLIAGALLDLAVHVAELAFDALDHALPFGQRQASLSRRARATVAVSSRRPDRRAQRGDALRLLIVQLDAGGGDFLIQRGGAAAQRVARFFLMLLQIHREALRTLVERLEPARHRAVQLIDALFQLAQGLVDVLAQREHLPLARQPEIVQAVEAEHHILQMRLSHAPGVGDVVGQILGRIADDRQMLAQALHIGERGIADGADGLQPAGIVAHQTGQMVAMLRQALDRLAAQRSRSRDWAAIKSRARLSSRFIAARRSSSATLSPRSARAASPIRSAERVPPICSA
jgi:hypothetical protein